MVCKKCQREIDNGAVICVHCGCKVKKPFYKKWWVWCIAAVILIALVSGTTGEQSSDNPSQPASEGTETADEIITYEAVDLSVMFEDLNSNAMKAEEKYQNKQIEFTAKIKSFDSDGKYVSVEPTNADEWNFNSATCYIKNDEQKSFLIEKNVGDVVTVKGKVKSIGEIMGYSIDIAEVQ